MLIEKVSLSILLLLLLTACAGSSNGSMTNNGGMPRLVMSAVDCGDSAQQPSLKLLRTQEEKAAVMSRMSAAMGDDSISQRSIPANEMLLQINMGRQSTGGYALKLMEDELVVEDGWANIKVKWITPAPGMMLTQALTSPCLLVAIPKQEYEGIRVIDQTGKIRLQTSL